MYRVLVSRCAKGEGQETEGGRKRDRKKGREEQYNA